MSWVLQAKKRVHVDEGQMQTSAVAEEQITRYPEFARLVRETERACMATIKTQHNAMLGQCENQ